MIVRSKKASVQQYAKDQRRRIKFILPIVCSLFFVVIFSSCGSSQAAPPPPPEFICPTSTAAPITLNMVYDSTEQAWMQDVIKDFDSQRITACDGPISVQATPMDSGLSMQEILDGKLQPDVWSPGGSAWISMLNQQWHTKHGSDLVTVTQANPQTNTQANPPSLITSPIVIAMWKSQAQVLGWPRNPINWGGIANLIMDPKGWGAYNHPEWGKFKFASPNSNYSNAGLDTLIAMNYAGTCMESGVATPNPNDCKTSGLTIGDVNNSNVKKFITTIESSAISYSTSTRTLMDQMLSHGPTYLNAIPVEESLVIQANDKTNYPNLPDKVVAIYPHQGTIVADYPLATLQGNWLTASRSAAALRLRDFLLSPTEQAKAVQYGFRPASGGGGAPIDASHGVDPGQPDTALPIPDVSVLQGIETNWPQQRRPFYIMLLVDTSGSMNFPIDNVPKIDGAKAGLKTFVKFMQDSDHLGLITFSNHTDSLASITIPLGVQRQEVLSNIDGILADGGVKLFDTMASQFQQIQQIPSTSIRAMIVLSNQSDNQSSTNLSQLIGLITPPSDQDPGTGIKIFTIAYGKSTNVDALTQIAKQTDGQEFSATPQNIQDIYQQIGELL
jgi:Ca-activated chloride channel family protein